MISNIPMTALRLIIAQKVKVVYNKNDCVCSKKDRKLLFRPT